ncbi:hypothetical protein RHMOL_Rhmol04G0368100 [Rhododendron molle]|uniref:Uncharacterized protein n=1 Tax=Rhododendron molle TaxID=49168 RepID=A0ACC0P889_RHOML|nr:hypothetical protein RHMOL_Rhmol04G0368100 [Rhododendron molle]
MENYNRSCEEYLAPQEQEGDAGKKYGGLVPKKKPLISKASTDKFLCNLPCTDHERAFFDSADWALCKQQQGAGVNQKTTIAVETLRPKLQRTPHQQLPPRRPACTSGSHAE